MRYRRLIAVAAALAVVSVTGWAWATSSASPLAGPSPHVAPEEDKPGWSCLDDGNQLCHPIQRTIPIRVTGHYRTGFDVWWSDGSATSDAPWGEIVKDCQRDEAPDVCITAWSGQYRMYGIARAMLRSAR